MFDVFVAALGGSPVGVAERAGELGDVEGVKEALVGFSFGGCGIGHGAL